MAKKQEVKKENEIKEKDPKAYTGVNALARIPFWLKATFFKYWYFGAACYFLGFGAGLQKYWFAFGCGIIGGLFYDIVVRHFLLSMETSKHEAKYHIMCANKGFISLPFNILYNLGIFYLGVFLLSIINQAGGQFGQEPLSFGLMILVIDVVCLLIKWGIMSLIKVFKKDKNSEKTNQKE